MKKTLTLLFTVIVVLVLTRIATATSFTYDFCLEENITHEAYEIEFPGPPSVTAKGWGGEFTNPITSIDVNEGYRKVHQCEFGLGVMSFDDDNPDYGADDDQHAIDGWIPDSDDNTPGHGGGSNHIYVEEKLYLEFTQEVTINSITFTRIDTYDDFSLSVDDIEVNIFHIADSYISSADTGTPGLDFEDFVTVNLGGYTGTIFEISTTEGCDDFKVARVNGESTPVPEPGTLYLLFFGLLGIIGFKKNLFSTILKRKKRQLIPFQG